MGLPLDHQHVCSGEFNLVTVIKSVCEQPCIVWANLASAVGYPGKDIVRLCGFPAVLPGYI